MSSLMLLSFLYSLLLRSFLRVELDFETKKSFPGQMTPILIQISNRGFLPTGPLWIEDNARNLEIKGLWRTYINLPPFSTLRMEYRVRGMNRGLYELGPLRVELRDPTGLFPWLLEIGKPREVVIYPSAVDFASLIWQGNPPGNLLQYRIPQPDIFRMRNVRPFESGDPIRHIHPQISARMGRLMSQVYRFTEDTPVLILLAYHPEDYPLKHRFMAGERALTAVAGLLRQALKRGASFSFATSGHCPNPALGFDEGAGHGEVLLENLGRMEWGTDPSIDWIFEAMDRTKAIPGMTVFYIGPPMNADLVDMFLRYRRRLKDFVALSVGTSQMAQGRQSLLRSIPLGDYGHVSF
jgi:uncharacterized protein (DUF58 family)